MSKTSETPETAPLTWTSETRALAKLKPYDKNPRRMSKVAYENLKRSLREDGYHQRLIANADGVIIGGHQRLRALKELGFTEVEVLIPSRDLTPQEFDRINIRDNLPFGDFDFDILANNFDAEQLIDWGMPDAWLPAQDNVVNAPAGDPDEAPAAPDKPRTKRGDVYEIGEHRLICGDSTSVDCIQKLLNGKKVEVVFTDPPYRMPGGGGGDDKIGRAASRLQEKIDHLCHFDPVAFLDGLPLVFPKNTLNAYVFCNKDLVPDYLRWGVESGYAFNILFWKKPTAIPLGGQHRPDVEYLLIFRKSAVWNNAIPDVNYSKCLEYGRDNGKEHPTKKPVELITNELQISSNPKGLVLDFFGGSGSTMVAAHLIGRTAYLCELSDGYCDVIVNRMAKLFPDLPIKLNGKPITWKK